ncbi:hypothetical protein WR25_25674 isoform B [Diploscapter pachys]|uniref:Nucleotide-diphospho-sugar transferase domain-containing protein n=1 Tax=Diploscapter pachys TaxID=2018661 RepID=A0A2A2L975_9BILA|nr:hypothetical protein WR25_25674 isoform B [Diploscapter pachys]
MSTIFNNANLKSGSRHCYILLLIFVVIYIFIGVLWYKRDSLVMQSISSIALYGQSEKPLNIAIVVITNDGGTKGYSYAIDTVKCYCKIQGYDFVLAGNVQNSSCNHSDHYFRRHCHVANILVTGKYDYLLFIDADIGVVNPNRRIEEFIDPKFDIEFYDRFVNQEIMMGSYIVKNSDWSINFLRNFANYQYRLPIGKGLQHGTDNGGIHGEGWARDNWLTNNMINLNRDFMIHAWKDKQLTKYGKDLPLKIGYKHRARWFNPLVGRIDLAKCNPKNTSWNYNPNLITTKEVIDAELERMYAAIEMEKIDRLSKMMEFIRRVDSKSR